MVRDNGSWQRFVSSRAIIKHGNGSCPHEPFSNKLFTSYLSNQRNRSLLRYFFIILIYAFSHIHISA